MDTTMENKEVVLGIDIGGTNTAFGYVDREGNILVESSLVTESHRPVTDYFERLHIHADQLLASYGKPLTLVGVGVGAPNGNFYTGKIEQAPNLGWKNVDVISMLKAWYSFPILLTNDANAAAFGEMLFGAAKGMKDFIIITLGTGVGSGIVSNGQLIYGHDGFAGEIGHTIVDLNGRLCGCGRRGCLETYASATGICRTIDQLLQTTQMPSELRSLKREEITSKRIFEAAQCGDKLALEAFELTGKILGLKLADAVAHTSPEAIILFGGLAAAGDLIFKPTKKYMEEYMLNIFKDKVRLLPSSLPKGNAAVLGSAALIWKEF
jgi:glucokinase